MRTGFVNIDDNLYYFNGSGVMATEWQSIEGYKYYFGNNGKAAVDWIRIDGVKYFFNSLGHMIGKNFKKIIDVSEHQGVIDWDTVKKYGDIDGVILRIGYNDVGLDAQFERNLRELTRLGIPYGVYLYSYAENATEAVMEADWMISLLKRFQVNSTLGIYYDVEQWSNLTVTDYDQIIPAFNNQLSNAGYTSWVYANLNFTLNLFSDAVRQKVKWIAQYYHYCQYEGDYNGWQYSSIEKVPGISTNVDMNVWFK